MNLGLAQTKKFKEKQRIKREGQGRYAIEHVRNVTPLIIAKAELVTRRSRLGNLHSFLEEEITQEIQSQ